MPSVLVIGAGISGLTVAYRLKQAGWSVRVLETSGQPGGAIQTTRANGFLSEAGPNSFMMQNAGQASLISDLGLDSELCQPGSTARRRYLMRQGKLIAAPSSLWSALTTPLFSLPAKLRILCEPFVPKPPGLVEESLASFVRRRLGLEFLDYAINPFVGGIYAGDPEQLSVQEAFPRLAALESRHGSLMRGALAKKKAQRAARAAGELPFQPVMASFEKGLQTLPLALARELGQSLSLRTCLLGLCGKQRWHASWQTEEEEIGGDFDHVVIAVPAHQLNRLPLTDTLRAALAPLAPIPHPPVTSLFLGYRRDQVAHPLDGFGALIPAVEKRNLLGVLFSSSLFPERAPEGHVALTAFVGGTRQPELARRPIESILQKVHPELEQLLGIRGEPVVVRPTVWHKAIPQYVMGYARYRERMDKVEKDNPGLHLLGNYRGGIALGQCIDNALALADRLTQAQDADV